MADCEAHSLRPTRAKMSSNGSIRSPQVTLPSDTHDQRYECETPSFGRVRRIRMTGRRLVSNERRPAEPASPQWSIITVRSLDISSNIPSRFANMDTEDSPWGGSPAVSAAIYVCSRLTGQTRCALAIQLECQPYQSFRDRRAQYISLTFLVTFKRSSHSL